VDTGVSGNGLLFNGSNQYLTVPSKGLKPVSADRLAWFKTSSPAACMAW